MPDNEYTFRFVSKAMTDTATFKAARRETTLLEGGFADATKSMDRMSKAFSGLGKSTGSGLVELSKTVPLSANLQASIGQLGKQLDATAQATSRYRGQSSSLATTMEQIRQAYKKGMIPLAAYRQATKDLQKAQKELGSMTGEQLAQSAVMSKALEMSRQRVDKIKDSMAELAREQGGLGAQNLERHAQINENIALLGRQMEQEVAVSIAAKEGLAKLSSEVEKQTGLVPQLGRAWGGLKESVAGVGQWFKQLPVRSLEAMKRVPENIAKGMKERFLEPGLIKGIGKTLLRSLYMGPLALVAGGRAKPAAADVSAGARGGGGGGGAAGGGMLGGLLGSLGSLGGILKYALSSLGPAALILKALAPALKALQHALEPIIAPFQEILLAVVQELAPGFAELGAWLSDMAKEIIPPLIKIVQVLVNIMKWWYGILAKLFIPIIKKIGSMFLWLVDLILSLPIIGKYLKKAAGLGAEETLTERIFGKEKGKGAKPVVKEPEVKRIGGIGYGGRREASPLWEKTPASRQSQLLEEQAQAKLKNLESLQRRAAEAKAFGMPVGKAAEARLASMLEEQRAIAPRPVQPTAQAQLGTPSAKEIAKAQATARLTGQERPEIVSAALSPEKQSKPVVDKLAALPAEFARKLRQELEERWGRKVHLVEVQRYARLAEGGSVP